MNGRLTKVCSNLERPRIRSGVHRWILRCERGALPVGRGESVESPDRPQPKSGDSFGCGGLQRSECPRYLVPLGAYPSTEEASFFRMCFARNSLISRWRGTGWETPVLGFLYQSWFPPCRTNLHPASSSLRIRSVRFIRASIRQPGGYQESHRLLNPGTNPEGCPPIPPTFRLGSSSRETPQSSRATCHDLANGRNGRCSCNYSSAGGGEQADLSFWLRGFATLRMYSCFDFDWIWRISTE